MRVTPKDSRPASARSLLALAHRSAQMLNSLTAATEDEDGRQLSPASREDSARTLATNLRGCVDLCL